MKFNCIEECSILEGLTIFHVGIADVPQEIQDAARSIDGEEYLETCFGMFAEHDLETGEFYIATEDDTLTGEKGNIYYIDNESKYHWFSVDLPSELSAEILTACKRIAANEHTPHGYEIRREVVFEDNQGFVYAENPNALFPYVTWQFTEDESGRRDYQYDQHTEDSETALKDYTARVAKHQKTGVTER